MDESAYSTLLKYVENTEYTENLTESEKRKLRSSVRYRRKTTGFKIIILLLTIFDGIMGCRRNGL
jgi:hypothetical protein